MSRFLAIVVLGLLPRVSFAERLITYEEALRTAEQANPTLAIAQFSVEQAQAGLKGARSMYDPNLNLNGTWNPTSRQEGFFQGFAFEQESRGWDLSTGLDGSFASGTAYSFNGGVNRNISTFTSSLGGSSGQSIQNAYSANFMLSVTQQLLKGHRFSYNVQNISLAETQWGLSELSYQQSHQQILSDVASAYWNWVYQEALTSIASDAVVVAEEALRVGEAKVEAGELAPVEETRLRAAYVQSQTSALDAQNGVYQAGDSLLLLMGLPSGESIAPATLVGDVVQMSIEIGSAVAVALAQNYDIRILRMNVDSSEQNLQNARHGMLPSLSATATTGLRSQYENEGETVRALAGLNDNSYPWAAISSNLSMPLGNRSSRSSLDTARSELAMRRQELANTERLVRSQVEEQVRTLTSSQERVRLADAQLALAQETLAGEESLVEAGRKIHKDLLEARNQLASAQGEAVKARIDSRIAQVQLLKLQGQLQID